jgi:hypothetical protein
MPGVAPAFPCLTEYGALRQAAGRARRRSIRDRGDVCVMPQQRPRDPVPPRRRRDPPRTGTALLDDPDLLIVRPPPPAPELDHLEARDALNVLMAGHKAGLQPPMPGSADGLRRATPEVFLQCVEGGCQSSGVPAATRSAPRSGLFPVLKAFSVEGLFTSKRTFQLAKNNHPADPC